VVATEIIPQLYVGTREDAEALGPRVPNEWAVISVTEYRSRYKRKEELPREPVGSLDLPFMADWPNGWHADPHKLDLIAETIWWRIQAGKRVLVHCIQAQERSPLAVVWYLVWSGAEPSIADAYTRVVKLHPRAQRRDTVADKADKTDTRQDWLRGATPRRSGDLVALGEFLDVARMLASIPAARGAASTLLEKTAIAWATRAARTTRVPTKGRQS